MIALKNHRRYYQKTPLLEFLESDTRRLDNQISNDNE